MAYLMEKLVDLKKALKTWDNVLKEPYSDIVRDATIQRYEYSFELLWKVIKLFLKEHDAIECNSPKSCFRELKSILNLTEKETELCLRMATERNLSVHTYSEKLAQQLYENTKEYLKISRKIARAITEEI